MCRESLLSGTTRPTPTGTARPAATSFGEGLPLVFLAHLLCIQPMYTGAFCTNYTRSSDLNFTHNALHIKTRAKRHETSAFSEFLAHFQPERRPQRPTSTPPTTRSTPARPQTRPRRLRQRHADNLLRLPTRRRRLPLRTRTAQHHGSDLPNSRVLGRTDNRILIGASWRPFRRCDMVCAKCACQASCTYS